MPWLGTPLAQQAPLVVGPLHLSHFRTFRASPVRGPAGGLRRPIRSVVCVASATSDASNKERLESAAAAATSSSGAAGVLEGKPQRRRRKQPGYWSDFANVEAELKAWMAENPSLFEPGRIPTQTALLSAGRSDLGNAIKQHGGWAAVTARVGLQARAPRLRIQTDAAAWEKFSRDVQAIMRSHGAPGMMPSRREFVAAGRFDLYLHTKAFGGMAEVATRLGLVYRKGPTGSRWRGGRFLTTAQVKAVIEGLWARGIGAPGFLPTRKEMVAAGERSLYDVLTSLGGLGPLAEALGLRRRPGRLEVTSKAILEYLKEKGLEGAVPPAAFFKREGRLDLLMELRSVGGPRKLAEALGLPYDKAMLTRERREAREAAKAGREAKKRGRPAGVTATAAAARGPRRSALPPPPRATPSRPALAGAGAGAGAAAVAAGYSAPPLVAPRTRTPPPAPGAGEARRPPGAPQQQGGGAEVQGGGIGGSSQVTTRREKSSSGRAGGRGPGGAASSGGPPPSRRSHRARRRGGAGGGGPSSSASGSSN